MSISPTSGPSGPKASGSPSEAEDPSKKMQDMAKDFYAKLKEPDEEEPEEGEPD
ncbi:hypothetical protein HLB44_36340 [Aquincola sp. S2]|uniref:Uncharacterized protein n=1 Tax=Pseudaquabacterium terrae TaxID=2732868 RepID=A0ABX2EUT0_9BURK|nr:hypothetical protein [Aquabacterium terrae]NRF72433.1 hypothetical protein [Aquabacterium terrae]